jgi:hypothetical protein
MSIEAIDAVWKFSRQKKSGALLVLLAVADHINKEGIAWPAVSTLALKVRMSKRNVQRWLCELQKAGELEVHKNQGRRGSNIYRIVLSNNKSNACDAHVVGDDAVASGVSSVSPTGGVTVTQSVSEPKKESTPIVPGGDEVEFWIQICFKCFCQVVHPVPMYIRRAVLLALRHLKKEHASSLLEFYANEPLNSKKPPYSSRRHSPERLMLDLPRQIALAVEECPPSPSTPPPKEYPFSLEDACHYLRQKYGDCRLPRSLEELHSPEWHVEVWNEIYEAIQKNKKGPNDAS